MLLPSDSIFSLPVPSKIKPTPDGMTTSVVAVKLILAPDVTVKSVLSPSIFSPVPNFKPISAGILISLPVEGVRFMSPSSFFKTNFLLELLSKERLPDTRLELSTPRT